MHRKEIGLNTEHVDTVVIGAGQAGLAVGYYLTRHRRDFVILEAGQRVGLNWRSRWDSLRLFTPARFNSLPGMPFPAPWNDLPTKDEMAGYLEAYAACFRLPVQLGVRVDELIREGDRYVISAGTSHLRASNVVVATGAYTTPRLPPFADQLDPAVTQVHSVSYRNSRQLRDGAVLVVGAGNSGAEIALDLASSRPTWLAGRDTGFIPVRFGGVAYTIGSLAFRTISQLLTVDTWPGQRVAARARAWRGGHPLVRVRPEDLVGAGVERVPRVTGVSGGTPMLEDGRVVDVENVVWCTGFVRDYRWIKLPVFDASGGLLHHRGVVYTEPGLSFTGLPFQSSLLSGLVAGAGADAKYIVEQIAARASASRGSGSISIVTGTSR
ncbi:MAG: SidA/IucD/PvdA family monooxygenase [Chloroflexi bacterium]|nr:SidA/IucD/PvdA family monooxygenase [Chloroflexota bacterium]